MFNITRFYLPGKWIERACGFTGASFYKCLIVLCWNASCAIYYLVASRWCSTKLLQLVGALPSAWPANHNKVGCSSVAVCFLTSLASVLPNAAHPGVVTKPCPPVTPLLQGSYNSSYCSCSNFQVMLFWWRVWKMWMLHWKDGCGTE